METRRALVHLEFHQNHKHQVQSLVLRCLAPRPHPDQCTLCRKRRHRASECPDEREATTSFWGKRALDTCALHCAVLNSPCYGTAFEQIERRKKHRICCAVFNQEFGGLCNFWWRCRFYVCWWNVVSNGTTQFLTGLDMFRVRQRLPLQSCWHNE